MYVVPSTTCWNVVLQGGMWLWSATERNYTPVIKGDTGVHTVIRTICWVLQVLKKKNEHKWNGAKLSALFLPRSYGNTQCPSQGQAQCPANTASYPVTDAGGEKGRGQSHRNGTGRAGWSLPQKVSPSLAAEFRSEMPKQDFCPVMSQQHAIATHRGSGARSDTSLRTQPQQNLLSWPKTAHSFIVQGKQLQAVVFLCSFPREVSW